MSVSTRRTVTRTSTPSSSWISSLVYVRGGSRGQDRYLAIIPSDCDDCVLLYGGPTTPIPPWLPGLIAAGTGRRSPGLAYNRLVKGKYDYTRVDRAQFERALMHV